MEEFKIQPHNHPRLSREKIRFRKNMKAQGLKDRLIERILVPIDGSSNSDSALEFAIDIAKKYSAEIYLLHVVSVMPICSLDSWETVPPRLYMVESEDEGEQIMASASNKVEEARVKHTVWLDHGQPASRIIQAAEEEAIDLIVMGSEKRGLMAKLFLGSISDKVSHRAPCPVLIVEKVAREG